MTDYLPGSGAPYWYEWTVGLVHAIELLKPEADLESVVFQAAKPLGLDDVVINYANRPPALIQVKHSIQDDTLTFASLVSPPSNGKKSLLAKIGNAWNQIATSRRASRN